jgi:hypothetical protein
LAAETVQENEEMYKTIEEIANLLLPSRIDLSDVGKHLRGYSKEVAVRDVVDHARQDPLITKIQLFQVYAKLQRLMNNGGI